MQLLCFHVLPDNSETLTSCGRKLNHNLIAYCYGNISAKYYQNQLMYVEITASNF